MAKTVKFNLICDGKPVRTVDDLRENFSIEDVLAYYHNQLLHRWLSVRGYTNLLEKVEEIKADNSMDIIKALIRIFDVEVDEKKVEESVYILQYKEEHEELLSIYKKSDDQTKAIIEDHQTGYIQLVEKILDNSNDISIIRAAISEMIERYYWIMQINQIHLFYTLFHKAPMAIFVMLTHKQTRELYLPQIIVTTKDDGTTVNEKDISKSYDDPSMGQFMTFKSGIYSLICTMISNAEKILGDNLMTFAGVTDGYWKDLEPSGKRFMIIDMKTGNFVRSAGKAGEELGYSDISNAFLILNGIDYKSNNATHKLLYMEV